MTRQWLTDPSLMCAQHISGEHLEAHIFLSKMMSGHSLKGYYDGGMFFGAGFLYTRHNFISLWLPGHKTDLELPGTLLSEYPDHKPTDQDYGKSIFDLISRCPTCLAKHFQILTNPPPTRKGMPVNARWYS